MAGARVGVALGHAVAGVSEEVADGAGIRPFQAEAGGERMPQVLPPERCDAACSYGVGAILPALRPQAAAAFLRTVLVPLYGRAGWPIARVLTDGGSEFKGAFDAACRELGIRHTRTKPRHAWTNGFVERLQGTILTEHWRVAFRRRYFTSRAQLQRSLDEYLRFYNRQRPHQGYRLRGQVPAALLWSAARAQA